MGTATHNAAIASARAVVASYDDAMKHGITLTPDEREDYDKARALIAREPVGRVPFGPVSGRAGTGRIAYRSLPSRKELRKAVESYEPGDEDRAFDYWLRTGHSGPEMRDGTGLTTAPDDAGVSAGSTGYSAGYMIPQGFWLNLQVAIRQFGGLEQDMRSVVTETGNPMPWPTIDPTSVVASVLGASEEITQASPVNVYQFGQGMLQAWTVLAPVTLTSVQLEDDSAFDVSEFVAARLGESIGRELAALAVNGTGSGQPLGVYTALTAKGTYGGVGTSGGLVQATSNSAVPVLGNAAGIPKLANGIFEASDLLNMITAVDPAYRNLGAKWYMCDSDMKTVRRLVDNYGHPLFADPTDGSPLRIFGYPVAIDNCLSPASTTASTVSGPVFGYMPSAFVFRQVQQVRMMRLVERWADFLAVGYEAWFRVDMRSNDLRALAGYKSPAS